jgi:alginate O-acetyltransferase complex protein AlgI
MVFSSLVFLYLFLPVCLLLYYAIPSLKGKNMALTALSLVFYAWGEPVWVLLLVFSAVLDYVNGRIIGRCRGRWQAKAALVCSVAGNLGILATFKYMRFFLDNIGLLIGQDIPGWQFALPIGISFYTFQTLSYTIDVYRGKTDVQRHFGDFLLFVSLFPQLVAGPILRYADLAAQLGDRRSTLPGMVDGITRFCCGLGKKVLIANYCGAVADRLLGGALDRLSGAEGWLGLLMFTFQIYFDFSGYSDMAIGLGGLFGFHYGENFRYPYTARSVTEFWRRWHISLSTFFRDYVYIPLGGNRRHQVWNLLVVWSLTGLWHGASWNFVLWGLYYYALLAVEKYLLKDVVARMPAPLSWMYAFFFACLGWLIFYFTDLTKLGRMFALLFGGAGFWTVTTTALVVSHVPLLLLAAAASMPIWKNMGHRLRARFPALVISYNLALLGLCTFALVGESYNPFLYYRF